MGKQPLSRDQEDMQPTANRAASELTWGTIAASHSYLRPAVGEQEHDRLNIVSMPGRGRQQLLAHKVKGSTNCSTQASVNAWVLQLAKVRQQFLFACKFIKIEQQLGPCIEMHARNTHLVVGNG